MNTYGVHETNPITPEFKEAMLDSELEMSWTDPDLKKITRLRLLSDRGCPFWDVSYCYGLTTWGEVTRVHLPFHYLPKKNMMGEIIEYAKAAGVHAKRLGLFGAISTLC